MSNETTTTEIMVQVPKGMLATLVELATFAAMYAPDEQLAIERGARLADVDLRRTEYHKDLSDYGMISVLDDDGNER